MAALNTRRLVGEVASRYGIRLDETDPAFVVVLLSQLALEETSRKVWATTLKKAGVPYFAPYELRHTFATRLSAGGVADHIVTQMLRQGDAGVFKVYSQGKLGMMREALAKLDRQANERAISSTQSVS
jgi:integrase